MNMTLDEDDIKVYTGAIIFMCQISHYWSNNERHHNSYMSKMFHISIPSQEVTGGKLRNKYVIYVTLILYVI